MSIISAGIESLNTKIAAMGVSFPTLGSIGVKMAIFFALASVIMAGLIYLMNSIIFKKKLDFKKIITMIGIIEITFSFTKKYFYSGDSNPFKTDVKKETVNSYIGSKGQLWNGTTATQDSFTLSSKLQVNINPIYSVNSDYTLDYDVTNGVTNSNNGAGSTGGSSTTTMTKPNNDITYSNFKDHLTLVGASVQYTYMNGTSGNGMENNFAKALDESLKSKEEATKPSTKEKNNDEPKVEKRKKDNGSTLTTWLNKANEFSKVTTNQDIQNYRNTLSTGFKNTITLTNTTSASLSKK